MFLDTCERSHDELKDTPFNAGAKNTQQEHMIYNPGVRTCVLFLVVHCDNKLGVSLTRERVPCVVDETRRGEVV